jgi:hypothetical protein
MCNSNISNVQGLVRYISDNSHWSDVTIRNVITALGYRSNGGIKILKKLSVNLADCAKHGADIGFPGFTYYCDTLTFFRRNRQDIIKNLECMAGEVAGEDIIGMIQRFGVFRYDKPPSVGDIGRALWGMGKLQDDLTVLYNVFAWFCADNSAWKKYPMSGIDIWKTTPTIMRDCPHNITTNIPRSVRGWRSGRMNIA